jgi:hypothetical protein
MAEAIIAKTITPDTMNTIKFILALASSDMERPLPDR